MSISVRLSVLCCWQVQLLHGLPQGKDLHDHPARGCRAVHGGDGTVPARRHHDRQESDQGKDQRRSLPAGVPHESGHGCKRFLETCTWLVSLGRAQELSASEVERADRQRLIDGLKCCCMARGMLALQLCQLPLRRSWLVPSLQYSWSLESRSQNHLGWKSPLRSLSPTTPPAPPGPQ